MATKNISRTIIEGGRRTGNKNDRYLSNKKQRAKERGHTHDARTLVDADDVKVAPKRSKVGKSFSDKLAPVYRWLASRSGKNWNKVYSELRETFDTRTIAGAHVVFDHMLSDVTTSLTDVQGEFNRFFVDKQGILRDRGKRFRYPRRKPAYTVKEVSDWTQGRRVMDHGTSMFWMVPARVEWTECGYYVGGHYYRGTCEAREHRKSTKLVLVALPEKLLAFEKKALHQAYDKNGEIQFYREVPIKICLRGAGAFKQGERFSKADLAFWNKLSQYTQEPLLWVWPASYKLRRRRQYL